MKTTKHLLMLLSTALMSVVVATTMTSCSFIDSQGPDTEQEEDTGNENTGGVIPEEPLTSGPATLSITRATATTACFEGSITNPEIDLDFVKIILRYAEPEAFSAMDENLPNVVVTKTNLDSENKFAFRIEDLKYNQSYKFCAIVQYKNDVFYSEVEEFKTADVKVNLAVTEGSVTSNSVELGGSVEGLSQEDREELEIGLFYSSDSSLVEKGEGEKVVMDNIEDDGVVSVALKDLYDAPKYYFCTYVKQGEECKLGKVGSFELTVEEVRLVKRITRTEKVLDNEVTLTYDFTYDNNRIVESKVIADDDYSDVVRYTYDYSTKCKVFVKEYWEEMLEQTYEINVDKRGNAVNFGYSWEDEMWENGEETIVTYNYVVDLTYTPEGYLSGWSETENGNLQYAVSLDYADGRLNKWGIDRKEEDEDYDTTIMLNDFSGNLELKNTSYDLNRALMLYVMVPEIEMVTFGAVNTGTYGKYYFDRMVVMSLWDLEDEEGPHDMGSTTADANYREVVTQSTYEVEGFEEDFGTLPITTVNCDAEGYPTEFIVDIRASKITHTITYGAGEVAWEDEYEGTTYYEIVELDRQTTEEGVTSVGKATLTVEYVD